MATKKKRKQGTWWKGGLVVLCSIALTTLVINASDGLRVPNSSLFAGVGASGEIKHCPPGMAYVTRPNGGFCVDRYENSPDKSCFSEHPRAPGDTRMNIAQSDCTPVSAEGQIPWTNVTLAESQVLCARAGKHLPTGAEWYRAAIGTPDELNKGCVLGKVGQEEASPAGAQSSCKSAAGAFDMVGNVWEWTDETARDGMIAGVKLPSTGYVLEADSDGFPAKTGDTPAYSFGGDHIWTEPDEVRGVFRGGFWSMNDRAGIFTMNATQPTSFVGIAVGFRCAKEAS
ncbi:MAG: hypothetical protein UY81_C0041G0002 [Candidatus Giovannonibacteria bacterium GW2011_GWA2_53_7]|uniref:Sulfatase-modifying factor enzyme-like domain-containing protein n=1 Tax=Candidatus Giovannonibacteria bacterium GW2011_GWA2_53_7 TaxID=1618650 RepID=A0A0G1XWT3_9BACT|nr:MAG: hypothetical protein UY81_C0041G0002 [Candidatus Giovannonibacteria bacterium GW2011_GWA2_53_7]